MSCVPASAAHVVRAIAAAAQVAVGSAAFEPASVAPAFLRVAGSIPDVSTSQAVLVVRALLVTLVCRFAFFVHTRTPPHEFHRLLSRLAAAETLPAIRAAYEACIVGFAPCEAGVRAPHDSTRVDQIDKRISSGVEYIWAHCCDRRLSLADVARQVNLSTSHFDRLLKRWTGHAYKEHLRAARMWSARTLLGRTFFTIKEVAAKTGYAKLSDFDREFKRWHGRTPTEWRRAVPENSPKPSRGSLVIPGEREVALNQRRGLRLARASSQS
jgi:AraC-like DNA-binding protein